jgi:hypothetical protein
MKLNGTKITASIVAGAAFLASGNHIATVAHEAGNPMVVAWIHAIGIDGLILIGINALGTARRAAVASIIYGAIVSLIFNAASYGAFEMPAFALAVTMPGALVLAYITQHSATGHKSTDTEDNHRDTATRTSVRLDVQRDTVPVPSAPSVQATTVHPSTSAAIVVPFEEGVPVAEAPPARKAITRTPSTRGGWDVAKATELVKTTDLGNAEIGAQVGTSYKTIQRLRSQIKNETAE